MKSILKYRKVKESTREWQSLWDQRRRRGWGQFEGSLLNLSMTRKKLLSWLPRKLLLLHQSWRFLRNQKIPWMWPLPLATPTWVPYQFFYLIIFFIPSLFLSTYDLYADFCDIMLFYIYGDWLEWIDLILCFTMLYMSKPTFKPMTLYADWNCVLKMVLLYHAYHLWSFWAPTIWLWKLCCIIRIFC